MNPLYISASRTASPRAAGSRPARPHARRSDRPSRAERISEAIVANYIHAISTRGAH